MEIFLFILLVYVIGAIPFGLIISKGFYSLDIRTLGSGNIGATNVLRNTNKTLSAITLLLDFSKAFIPTIITKYNYNLEFATLIGVTATIGHIFSLWVGFKGGKGIACIIGVFFALNPVLGLVCGVMWITIFKIFRYASLASLLAVTLTNLLSELYVSQHAFTLLFILNIVIIIKHYHNIKKLLTKQENKF